MNRQRLILFILMIVFIISVFWSYRAMPRPKKAESLTYKPGQVAKVVTPPLSNANQVLDDGLKLKIGLLDGESSGFKGYRRNIFKPVFGIEKKVDKKKVEVVKPPPPVLPVTPVTPPVVKPEPAPLARFTFLGFLKKGSVRTIFLAKEKDILLVKKGDKIADRYNVTEITDQALTLLVTDTGGEIVIPLLENRPLTSIK